MSRKQVEHVVFDSKGAFWCRHCGERYAMQMPAPIDVMVGACDAFTKTHQRCKPNAAVAQAEEERRDKSFGDPMKWIDGPDAGISSKTIWSVMMDRRVDRLGIPWDPADFGRCHRLLEAFPAWRTRLPELAARWPAWRPLVENWDRMTALYVRDEPTGKSAELYALMQRLTDGAPWQLS